MIDCRIVSTWLQEKLEPIAVEALERYTRKMEALKATVKNGRLVLDEPTELPDGKSCWPSSTRAMTWTTRSALDCMNRCIGA